MGKEIQVRVNLSARKGNLKYSNQLTFFNADFVTVEPHGPTPDFLVVPVVGVDILFQELTDSGGWCFVANVDDEMSLELGVSDGVTYLPWGELKPGEGFPWRLSPRLQAGGGTGTGAAATLRLAGVGGPCRVTLEALDP